MSAPTTDVELLLNEVRDLHPAFDRYRADVSPALRALRRVLARMVKMVVLERPEALVATEVTQTILPAHFTSGYQFTAAVPLSVTEVAARRLQTTAEYDRLERLGADGGQTAVTALAVQVAGNIIRPVQSETEWVSHDQWRVKFIPHPSSLTLRGATAAITVLPLGTVREALLTGTAAELARGLSGQSDAPDPGMFGAADEMRLALDVLNDGQGYEVFRKRDVMPYL